MFDRRLAPVAVGLFLTIIAVHAQEFAEEDGLVVMEAESVPMDGDWTVKQSVSDYTGTGYIEAGNSGTLQYPITFFNTGTYSFQWRVSSPHKTEHNDSFVRMTGPSVQTRSGGGSPCYTGDWIKVYGAGGSSWSWDARNCDNTQKHVTFTINQPGDYLFEIKQRSTRHKIDRIVINDESRVSTSSARNLSQAPTLSDGSTPSPSPESVSIDALDFDNRGDFYIDGKYLAIDPMSDSDKSGTATEPFDGVDGTYDITFYGVGEEDGESMYELYIDNVLIGEYQVAQTSEAFAEGSAYNETWTDVAVNNGDIIKVVATAHSNGTIPESGAPGGHAWSRARWYRIDLDPSDGSGGTTPEPTAIVEPASGTTLVMGSTVTLKGTGTNLSWAYDANSDGLSEIVIGSGQEVSFEVPTGITGPMELTLILRGSGGTVDRTYSLTEGGSTAAASPRAALRAHGSITSLTIHDLAGRRIGRGAAAGGQVNGARGTAAGVRVIARPGHSRLEFMIR
jgi:hypothetical protein